MLLLQHQVNPHPIFLILACDAGVGAVEAAAAAGAVVLGGLTACTQEGGKKGRVSSQREVA
jgi:hypothetical protein